MKAEGKKRPNGAQKYLGNGAHDWEDVTNHLTQRLRVPGGWLYRDGSTMSFVPVPDAVGYAV
jgi:hypothetical protein